MNKTFTLIICTYLRSTPLLELLMSVVKQSLYPNEILIIDGSTNDKTKKILEQYNFKKVKYYKVDNLNRGLTKQRNYGINLVSEDSEIVCFLDDDIILEKDYFEQLLNTYITFPEALAVGGYITNEVTWKQSNKNTNPSKFYFDGWIRNEPSRFKLRRKFGLQPDVPPGFMPDFSNGRSVSFLPPSGRVYNVEQLMGGVSSYKKEVFKTLSFSPYFEGYGLYEDADFSLRLAKQGKLYINTKAQLQHHHNGSGRPNKYHYGKMVIRNGWYVWRIKNTNPSFKAQFKWHGIALLLTVVRIINIVTTKKRIESLTESLGRAIGWFSLLFNKPKIQK
ncbi:glycosyltransferase family 2 protein [Thalassobellus citreus]|uniref:glycosyltransferase family 2 protein n=1 Tax=Thalassobellus citreus TaxID=3367752 RepID=UPI0037A61CD7